MKFCRCLRTRRFRNKGEFTAAAVSDWVNKHPEVQLPPIEHEVDEIDVDQQGGPPPPDEEDLELLDNWPTGEGHVDPPNNQHNNEEMLAAQQAMGTTTAGASDNDADFDEVWTSLTHTYTIDHPQSTQYLTNNQFYTMLGR